MKIFFYLLLFIIYLVLTAVATSVVKAANDTIFTKSDFGLKGEVISFKEKSFSAKNINGKIENKNLISSSEYKVFENLVLRIATKADGIITNYFYNEKKHLMECRYISMQDGSVEGKKLYFYDETAKPILELQYNSKGNIQDSIVVLASDDMAEFTEISYHPLNGKFMHRIDKRYNQFNKIDKKVKTTNEASTRFLYTYDTTGNILEEKWYLNNELVQKIEFEYNSRGNMIKRIEFDEKEKPFSTITYDYDPISGLELEIKSEKNTTNFEYNFDNNGNWTVRYEFYNKTPIKITEREIEYKNSP